jgi:pyrroloquinoline quinone biosynthesis protein B
VITVVVLGTAQDGGVPHLGCRQPRCERARRDPALARRVASLGVIDSEAQQSYLIDATPDVRAQLDALTSHPLAAGHAGGADGPAGRRPAAFGTSARTAGSPLGSLKAASPEGPTGGRASAGRNPVDGLILTHAHIGHYTGLVQFGKEVMATRNLPTYCTASMRDFLQANGPWSQLLRDAHLQIHVLSDNQPVRLTDHLSIRPFLVPHRQEWSDTIGLELIGPAKSLIYIPDIDSWSDWPCDLRAVVSERDIALLDGCFHDGGELSGRSMVEVPHPWMTDTMERLKGVRTRVLFTHMNHTNPALDDDSAQRSTLEARGFGVASDGMEFEL